MTSTTRDPTYAHLIRFASYSISKPRMYNSYSKFDRKTSEPKSSFLTESVLPQPYEKMSTSKNPNPRNPSKESATEDTTPAPHKLDRWEQEELEGLRTRTIDRVCSAFTFLVIAASPSVLRCVHFNPYTVPTTSINIIIKSNF